MNIAVDMGTAAGGAAAEARGLEGELLLKPFASFTSFSSIRLFVADSKGDPEGAAAEDGLDSVPALYQVPGAERVVVVAAAGALVAAAAAAPRRRRRQRRRRRGKGSGSRTRRGDLSPRPLEGDERLVASVFRGRVGVVVVVVLGAAAV